MRTPMIDPPPEDPPPGDRPSALPSDASATCAEIGRMHRLRASLEAQELLLVAHLCDTAPPPPPQQGLPGRTEMVPGGGDGTPRIPEFLHLELGPVLGTTPFAARRLIADVLDLRHRLPQLWRAVLDCRIPVALGRRIAALCGAAHLSRDGARGVDDALAGRLEGLGFGRAVALAEAEIVRADPVGHRAREDAARRERCVRLGRPDDSGTRSLFARLNTADAVHVKAMVERLSGVLEARGDGSPAGERNARALGILASPARAVLVLAGASEATTEEATIARALDGIDPDRLIPPVRLYVHAHLDALDPHDVARVEDGPAVLVERLPELLGTSRVRVTQVLDTRDSTATDAYEVPAAMRERLTCAQPYEVFPWSTRRSRRLDLDHTRPFRPGRRGQTRPDNLGPLGRTVHRARTHGGFRVEQPVPGLWIWQTPLGGTYSVTNRGATAWGPNDSMVEIVAHHRIRSAHP